MTRPTLKQLARKVDQTATADEVSVRRVRRWIAAIALTQILNVARARGIIPGFLVKGGFALELRFHGEARASRDVDVVIPLERQVLMDAVIEALRIGWSGFTFQIKGTPEERDRSFRFELNSRYANQDWSTFELELVFDQIIAQETVTPIDLSVFGLLQPDEIPCMTAAEQIAQKLHAATDQIGRAHV